MIGFDKSDATTNDWIKWLDQKPRGKRTNFESTFCWKWFVAQPWKLCLLHLPPPAPRLKLLILIRLEIWEGYLTLQCIEYVLQRRKTQTKISGLWFPKLASSPADQNILYSPPANATQNYHRGWWMLPSWKADPKVDVVVLMLETASIPALY